ncbi:DUF1573 domain-containing protein, partial [Candidatus Parcubacteria bacterium]|nr:DUF1573 domain-containing protein [Candidatus Parcubacteria bacterium]
LPLFLLFAGCTKGSSNTEDKTGQGVDGDLVIEKIFHDFGTISMDQGKVATNFKVTNKGAKPVTIKEMYTSCMCTKVSLIVSGKESKEVGMKTKGVSSKMFEEIKPGEEVEVKVVFDPNAHGPSGTGINRRSVFLETDSKNMPSIKLEFQANVVKSSRELSLFNFDKTEFDFGTIKQSGGKVSYDFALTYNGEQDIEIVGVPTSCGCTSAEIDKMSLSKGDKATIRVSFDPNLHAEPEGKFFKTINLLTEPKIGKEPELKIWAEIDLDLGPSAYKLKSDHDEEEEEHEEGTYSSITPLKFDKMLDDKDFLLVDVHIPEQEHIKGTDLFIPFNELEENTSKLPADKDAKIVVYCRSGSMSRAAAYSLIEMGYSNIYDLSGGKQAYDDFIVD